MNYKYPLQSDNFSYLDRLKVAAFVLNSRNKLTSGPKVLELEDYWKSKSRVSAVATSSGSTANHLLLETFLQTHNFSPSETTVFCPATTWASSVSPMIMRGCKVVFVDINLKDFSFDYQQLHEKVLLSESKVNIIWPTALIGFVPDIERLDHIAKITSSFLFADLCECTMGEHKKRQILGCFPMSTTSFFWAHQICSVEGGMLFIDTSSEIGRQYYANACSIRSHGLVRSLPLKEKHDAIVKYEHLGIDKEFLFCKIGTNYRLSDLHAAFGILDSKRSYDYELHRKSIWRYFNANLPPSYQRLNVDIVPFCLPLIYQGDSSKDISKLKQKLNHHGWETRPIISFLPKNPAYSNISPNEAFPNSEYLHSRGFYVGLNGKLQTSDIDRLFSLIQDE